MLARLHLHTRNKSAALVEAMRHLRDEPLRCIDFILEAADRDSRFRRCIRATKRKTQIQRSRRAFEPVSFRDCCPACAGLISIDLAQPLGSFLLAHGERLALGLATIVPAGCDALLPFALLTLP